MVISEQTGRIHGFEGGQTGFAIQILGSPLWDGNDVLYRFPFYDFKHINWIDFAYKKVKITVELIED